MRNTTLCGGLALAAVCCLIPSAAALSPAEVLDADPYAARKVFYEDYWQQKIERVLAYVPGAIVCVEAELSQEVEKTVTSESLNGTPVTTFEEESESTRSAGEDLKPGPQTAGPGAAAGEPLEQESHRSATSKTTAPMSETVTRYAGLVPENVWVSIVVPEDYVDAVVATAAKREAPMADADRTAFKAETRDSIVKYIKTLVEPLLPDSDSGKDDFSHVKVVYMPRVGDDAKSSQASTTPLKVGDLITVIVEGGTKAVGGERRPARIRAINGNGLLLLESREELQVNGERVLCELSGETPLDRVAADRTVLTRYIAELRIDTRVMP